MLFCRSNGIEVNGQTLKKETNTLMKRSDQAFYTAENMILFSKLLIKNN